MATITVTDGCGNFWEEEHTPDPTLHAKNVAIDAQTRLASSDWTMISDVGLTPSCKTAFENYRAILRGIRLDGSTLPDSGWPEEPAVEFS
jgi:hypothetical protein